MSAFYEWWYETGSGIAPLPNHDHEEHAERVARVAWETATEQLRKERDEAKELVKFLIDHITESLDCTDITQVIPPHECDFSTNPERGKCSFCETWVSAMMLVYPDQFEEVD